MGRDHQPNIEGDNHTNKESVKVDEDIEGMVRPLKRGVPWRGTMGMIDREKEEGERDEDEDNENWCMFNFIKTFFTFNKSTKNPFY